MYIVTPSLACPFPPCQSWLREGHLPIWYTAVIPTREILGTALGRYEQAVNKPLELGGGEAGCPVRKDILFVFVIITSFIYLVFFQSFPV